MSFGTNVKGFLKDVKGVDRIVDARKTKWENAPTLIDDKNRRDPVRELADLLHPEEAEIQVYVNMRKTFIELESQGAYTELKPGAELKWTVTWYLAPYDGKTEPSEALKQKVKSLIG